MYLSHFGLREAPFSIAPNPRFLYSSLRHQEALAHLLYGIQSDGGFVLLTGEVGSGKTTLCRCLLEQIPEHCDVAYLFNPKLSATELLASLCHEIGVEGPPGPPSVKALVDALNAQLLRAHAAGRKTVLIIDEAQNLSVELLEQIRLLTNLETSEHKLLHIMLIGQPELRSMLERPELRQLNQRIVARYHLGPLTKDEVAAYIQHRLECAGTTSQLIPRHLSSRIYRLSAGIPRLINLLCDRALLGACAQGKTQVDISTLTQAAHEVLPRKNTSLLTSRWSLLVVCLSTILALSLLWPLLRTANHHFLPAAEEPAQITSGLRLQTDWTLPSPVKPGPRSNKKSLRRPRTENH